jgi:hypothetical protein
MAVAMMYPTGTKGKSIPEIGNTQGESKKTFQNNLSMARTVLRADPVANRQGNLTISFATKEVPSATPGESLHGIVRTDGEWPLQLLKRNARAVSWQAEG